MTVLSGASSIMSLAQQLRTANNALRTLKQQAPRAALKSEERISDKIQATQPMRNSLSRLAPVHSSLKAETSHLAVVRTALDSAQTVLSRIKLQLEAAKSTNADQATIQSNIVQLRQTLRTIIETPSGGDRSLFVSDSTMTGGGNDYSFLSAVNEDSSGTVTFPNQTLSLDQLRLYDTSAASLGIVQRSLIAGAISSVSTNAATPSLNGLSGPYTLIAGTAAGSVPSMSGLSGTASTVAGGSEQSRAASFSVDLVDPASFTAKDRVSLTVTLNGNTKTVAVRTDEMGTITSAQQALQTALNAAYGSSMLRVSVSSQSRFSVETVAVGSGQTLTLDALAVIDGDGVVGTSDLNMRTDPNPNWVNNSYVDGANRSSQKYNFTTSGLDTGDSIKLRIVSYNAGTASGTNGQYAANGTQTAFDVTVSLANVIAGNKASLVQAIKDGIAATPGASAYFDAGINRDGGEIAIYHKTYGSSIRVSAVTLLDGNGVGASTPAKTVTTLSGTTQGPPASATTGSDFTGPIRLSGGSLSFDLSVNGSPTSIVIDQSTVDAALSNDAGYVAGSGIIDTVSQFALVVQRAVTDAGIGNIAVTTSGSRLTFTKTGSRSVGDSVQLSQVQAQANGDGRVLLQTGSTFTGPQTISASGTIRFDIAIDGTPAKAVELTRATVDTALAGKAGYVLGSGRIANADQFADVIREGLSAAGLSELEVTASQGRIIFAKDGTETSSIALSNVDALSGNFGAPDITLDSLDVGAASFDELRSDQRNAVLDALIAGIDARSRDVAAVGEYLQRAMRRIEIQQDFNMALDSILSSAIGQRVNPDMTTEMARQVALDAQAKLLLESQPVANTTR